VVTEIKGLLIYFYDKKRPYLYNHFATGIMKADYKRYLKILAGAAFFLSVFYLVYSFAFEIWNNEEELPLIYKLMGLASYPGDYFIDYHTGNYSQVTPYIFIIAGIGRFLGLSGIEYLYFALHFITILFMYLGLRKIHNLTSGAGESAAAIILVLMMLFVKYVNPIPSARWLFINFLDPELVTFPFIFFSIAFYVEGRHRASAALMAAATIFHPLYTLPLLFPVMAGLAFDCYRGKIVLKSAAFNAGLYLSAVMPYTFYVWLKSRPHEFTFLDPSVISEFIRAPEHHIIPTLSGMDIRTVFFYVFCLLSTGIAIVLIRNNGRMASSGIGRLNDLLKKFHEKIFAEPPAAISNENEYNKIERLLFYEICLILFLVGSSIVSGFVRIPILVQLTPYRISVIIIPLSWIAMSSSILMKIKPPGQVFKPAVNAAGAAVLAIMIAVVMGTLPGTWLMPYNFSSKYPVENEIFSWIKKNTAKSDMFINYTGLDVRTYSRRPVYFNFKTYHLTSDSQIEWYKRYLVQYDVPRELNSENYPAVKNYINGRHEINLSGVVEMSGYPVKMVLAKKYDDKNIIDFTGFLPVFDDGLYIIYKKKR